MWPWEHLAVGYLVYSAYSRRRWGRPPTTRAAVVVAVAAVFPDLVDKPLAWWLGVLPGGRSLAHSLLVAGPVVLAVLAVGRRLDERPASVAFAVGFLSHLAGDVVYPLVVRGELRAGFLFWPVVPVEDGDATSALPHLQDLAGAFLEFLATPRGTLYLLGDVVLLGLAVFVWVLDGTPGVRSPHPESSDESGSAP